MSNSFFVTATQNTAKALWSLTAFLNRAIPARPMPNPCWAKTKSLPLSSDREQLDRKYPESTQSLCPECNKESVRAVLEGNASVAAFRDHPGLIDAFLVEDNGRIPCAKLVTNTVLLKTSYR